MAYQTLPNTFVSGTTIYSTAVSANMVALLNGYTAGSYDAYFSSATVSGPVNVTGAAGNLHVAGDIYTTAWATMSTASAGCTGWDGTMVPYIRYKQVGKMVMVNLMLEGTSTATAKGFNLPISAASSFQDNFPFPAVVMDAGAEQAIPGVLIFSGADSRAVTVQKTNTAPSFTAAGIASVRASFFYEVD